MHSLCFISFIKWTDTNTLQISSNVGKWVGHMVRYNLKPPAGGLDEAQNSISENLYKCVLNKKKKPRLGFFFQFLFLYIYVYYIFMCQPYE